MMSRSLLQSWSLCCLWHLSWLGVGDFVYPDFESTAALSFNEAAATSSCDRGRRARYQSRHGSSDGSNVTMSDNVEEGTTLMSSSDVRTMNFSEAHRIRTHASGFGHRDEYAPHPTRGCKVRLRLTPSEPRRRGSVWHDRPMSVLRGFQTEFAFQITDPSRSCTEVKDRNFGTKHHTSCTVHGGDGLAFVIHDHPNRTATLGLGGEDMGYGGVRRSLAVEFDSWYNPELGDLVQDHVSIQTGGEGGRGSALDNRPGASARLNIARAHPVADGKVHVVRVAYWPFLRYDLVPYFTASSVLPRFIMDHGEGRRVGTFAVYVDDLTTPLLAVPINLGVALELSEGLAFAGFTSSTGLAWQKHDILSWYFCEDHDECGFRLSNDLFDYHEATKNYTYRFYK